MVGSTGLLALLSLRLHPERIHWVRTRTPVLAVLGGALGAFVLYGLFVLGNIGTADLGLSSYVSNVYAMIYQASSREITIVLLALIGIFEEIYWRGALQGTVEGHPGRFQKYPWVLSTAYYTFVHISTLNPILVGAAMVVGLVTSLVADRVGISGSIVTHLLWIEAIVVFFPV
ncbi:MAG: CPBP family intramembrane metalloprotease [Candidatus Thermoplasmatota archaeon]|nr:CPBP family intramembrane metalloprotease [Candidatus Thermoplasmatota archaeon]